MTGPFPYLPQAPGNEPSPFPGPTLDARADAIWTRLRNRFFTQAGNYLQVAVTAAAASVVVTFVRTEPNVKYLVFAFPSWNTTAYSATGDRTVTAATIHFGTAAPGGGGTVDVVIVRDENA